MNDHSGRAAQAEHPVHPMRPCRPPMGQKCPASWPVALPLSPSSTPIFYLSGSPLAVGPQGQRAADESDEDEEGGQSDDEDDSQSAGSDLNPEREGSKGAGGSMCG